MNAYAIPGIDRDVVGDVFNQVCKIFYKKPEEVMQKVNSRGRTYVLIRQLTMAILRQKTLMSYSEIGDVFRKDHATAIHSVKAIDNLRETDKQFKRMTDKFFTKKDNETIRL